MKQQHSLEPHVTSTQIFGAPLVDLNRLHQRVLETGTSSSCRQRRVAVANVWYPTFLFAVGLRDIRATRQQSHRSSLPWSTTMHARGRIHEYVIVLLIATADLVDLCYDGILSFGSLHGIRVSIILYLVNAGFCFRARSQL
ncbi:uncharacterized protein ARMOST_10064 [Armillaria ostoyae]|uniref:Uncharacterized protein n=1 Tax=Armillaria ostoyae TaxID=47428 RepID=A0A284RD80_ARMOS|nr:uncharacterized protein ARMOST_10064 [Armillaria ostoyae]